jgi:drug/metabolite transporter (DMT)-like permease
VCAVIATALWGSAFPAVKIGFSYFEHLDMQTRLAFAGIRFLLAGLMLLAFIPKRRQKFSAAPKLLLFGAAFLQVCLQYLFFYWGLSLISASLTAIIVGTGSFWWVLAAPLVDKRETVTIRQLLVLLLGFAGVVVCMYEPENSLQLGGALLVMLATMSGTGALLMVRPLSLHVPVTFITGFSLFAGGFVFILLAPERSLSIILHSPWQLQLLTLYLAFLSATAFSLWYWLITLYDVTRLSAYRFLIPIFGVFESVLFLTSETLSGQLVTGGALVILSIVILEALSRRKKRAQA